MKIMSWIMIFMLSLCALSTLAHIVSFIFYKYGVAHGLEISYMEVHSGLWDYWLTLEWLK